ncbi:MAG: phytanoyl-CoA dioxygenase family protein, partial [Candidatus Poribacteria bacterium]|nr:phytanoyl-CoA dioxygenase family protein [Candidatus Poribacteria bacterium]
MTSTTSNDLPQPTTDLDLAKANLDQFGYCLIAGALNGEEVLRLRRRLEEQAAAEKQRGLAYEDAGPNQNGVNQRVWFLVNKGQVFRDLLLHRVVRELVGHVLGDEYLLSSFTANIAKPGGVMGMHTDQWWMPQPVGPGGPSVRPGSMTRAHFRGRRFDQAGSTPPTMMAPAVACNVMWMLTDFTSDNGATRVVPRSHLSGRQPDTELDVDVEGIPAVSPAGTAMVFEARLWHSTGANVSDSPRLGVLSYFCAPQFRQQENLMVGTHPKVLKDAPPELLALLGLKVWQGYGRIESPTDEYISPGQTSLG